MVNLKRILCPIDLSPASGEALRYAVALAKAYDATLYLCHAAEESSPPRGAGRETLRRTFATLVREHGGLINPETINCEAIITEGEPSTAITHAAAARRVDLIVMRSRRRPLAAALLGSTAEAVCRTAPCPVLVTHPEEREWVGNTSGAIALQRILIAHDFSNDSELALNYGLMLAQEYQAELHLLHVLPFSRVPDLQTIPDSQAGAFHQARRRLQSAVPPEAFLWCAVKQAVRTGQPYREILAYAEEHDIDLICLGVHGAGFAMRALFGSNADRVLRQAPCPVLIARPLKPLVSTEALAKEKSYEKLVSC